MRCKGAIFDMDGLLFDSEKVYQATWHELAAERGIVLEDGFLRDICGANGANARKVVERYYHVEDGSQIQDACMQRVIAKFAACLPVKEGVPELLEFFRQRGVRMAVASSSLREQIDANLQKSGLGHYFDAVVCGAEVKHGKPAPDIFLHAAERIGLEPGECFVFEDSENGVRAGHAAGCMTVMVPDLIEPSPQILAHCMMIAPSLWNVREVLESMA